MREVRRTNVDDTEEYRDQFRIIARAMQEVNTKKRDSWSRFEKEYEREYKEERSSAEERAEEKK